MLTHTPISRNLCTVSKSLPSCFSPTLYVGEHEHGLYAMPSLVDQQTLTIAPSSTGPLLLEGPQNFQVPSEINLDVISDKESARVRGFGSADAGGVDPDDPLGIPIGAADDHEGREKSSVLLFGERIYTTFSTKKSLFCRRPYSMSVKAEYLGFSPINFFCHCEIFYTVL